MTESPNTPRDPAADLAICEAATKGPWHVMEGTFGKVRDPRSATVYATNDDLVYVARCDGRN